MQSFKDRVDIVPNRRFFLTHANFPYEFELLDMEGFLQYASFFWLKGDPEIIQPKLKSGDGVIISEVFSNRTGLSVGDLFRAQVAESSVELPILGIVRDYRTHGGVVFYSMPHFKVRYHDPHWGGLRLFFKDRAQKLDTAVANLRADIIEKMGDKVDILSGKRLRGAILRIFDETFAITTVLLLIALVIAALGIATTLTVLTTQHPVCRRGKLWADSLDDILGSRIFGGHRGVGRSCLRLFLIVSTGVCGQSPIIRMDLFIWSGLGIAEHIDSADYHNGPCCSAAGSENGFPETAGNAFEGTLIINHIRRSK